MFQVFQVFQGCQGWLLRWLAHLHSCLSSMFSQLKIKTNTEIKRVESVKHKYLGLLEAYEERRKGVVGLMKVLDVDSPSPRPPISPPPLGQASSLKGLSSAHSARRLFEMTKTDT